MAIGGYIPNSRLAQPGVCSSTTRPASPYEGQVIYETDTDKVLVWNGSAWTYMSIPQTTEPGVWASYTPTLTQSGAVTKNVTYAKYTQINKTCICNVTLAVTGSGTSANGVKIGLPLTSATSAGIRIGVATVYDASADILYNGSASIVSTTEVWIVGDWSGGGIFGGTPSTALANGDYVSISVHYEIA